MKYCSLSGNPNLHLLGISQFYFQNWTNFFSHIFMFSMYEYVLKDQPVWCRRKGYEKSFIM